MNEREIQIHSTAIANGRIMDYLAKQGGILIDGQARAIATGLLPPTPPKDSNAPEPVQDNQILTGAEHPYDKMARETKERFPHCHQEIDTFFEVEKLRNKQEQETGIGDAVSRASVRSLQWAYFWEGIKKLELDRHNDEIRLKKLEKKKKKGQNNGPRKGFNGPTYTLKH